jgi:S-adenosylmethionine-diacylglycerol 3-amino-3-carboxypropyl transferase
MPTSLSSETALQAVPLGRPATSEPPEIPYGGRLMFAQSWEDPACDLEALRPSPGATIFAVTSGGDNVLGFLLSDPARIVAVDLNPTQTWLLELKMAAIRQLSHGDLLHLVGVRPGGARDLYASLRADLSDEARSYWDGRLASLDTGLLASGGFERYFALLRRGVHLVVGRRRVEGLFAQEPAEQAAYFARRWNTRRWRTIVRLLCSRLVLGNRLDPSWFEGAETPSFGAHFERLARHVLAELPARTNYFLAQILLGRYLDEEQVPAYLERRHLDTLRARLDRIHLVTRDVGAALEELPPASIDCFQLSNVFEYSPVGLFDRSRDAVHRAARPGARISLRNLLKPRRLEADPRFTVDRALGQRLQAADRGFIYAWFEASRLAQDPA